MLTSGVVLLHDNARPHTAAHAGAQLEYFNWGLFDYYPYSPNPTPSGFHLFPYLNNNEELTEDVKTWLNSKIADIFDTGTQYINTFPDTSASIPAVTTLRSSLNMYVFFVYSTFFLTACFVNGSPEVTFRIALVLQTE
jgi:hypothetical protein